MGGVGGIVLCLGGGLGAARLAVDGHQAQAGSCRHAQEVPHHARRLGRAVGELEEGKGGVRRRGGGEWGVGRVGSRKGAGCSLVPLSRPRLGRERGDGGFYKQGGIGLLEAHTGTVEGQDSEDRMVSFGNGNRHQVRLCTIALLGDQQAYCKLWILYILCINLYILHITY